MSHVPDLLGRHSIQRLVCTLRVALSRARGDRDRSPVLAIDELYSAHDGFRERLDLGGDAVRKLTGSRSHRPALDPSCSGGVTLSRSRG